MWIQAWNMYLTVVLAHNPTRALELIGYQRIITSASLSLPLHAWLKYDGQFRTMAACNPYLWCDQRHPDLWHETMTYVTSTQCWPCSYCGARTHFPDNCPRSPFRDSTQRARPPNRRESGPPIYGNYNNGRCTRNAYTFQHICLSCKGTHHVSPVQTGDRPLTNSEAMPGHAYTAHTTAREHTSYITCTNTSQHTSCTSSPNGCHTTSHIDSQGYDSGIKGLHLSHFPYASTLKDNSHITSSAQYATKLVHTSTPAHNFSPQLQNLIELQILHNIPRKPINIYNLHRELCIIPSQPDIRTGSHC